jgi:RNA polymerase sigma-70 factor (ECF subfamily)
VVVNLWDATVDGGEAGDGGPVPSGGGPDPVVEQDLAERLCLDLDAAFAEVVQDHERAVFTTALRVSGRTADAQDLAAETFLRAYSALRRYGPDRIRGLRMRPWLITICLNHWRNQLRRASRRPRPESLRDSLADAEPTSLQEGPEEGAARGDDRQRLASLLQELPRNQRVAVVLRHVVGLSYAEVAGVLRCPEGTAKSHVSRGLDRLRTLTDEELP